MRKNKQSRFEIDLADKWVDPQPINEPPPEKNKAFVGFFNDKKLPFPVNMEWQYPKSPTQHINQPMTKTRKNYCR